MVLWRITWGLNFPKIIVWVQQITYCTEYIFNDTITYVYMTLTKLYVSEITHKRLRLTLTIKRPRVNATIKSKWKTHTLFIYLCFVNQCLHRYFFFLIQKFVYKIFPWIHPWPIYLFLLLSQIVTEILIVALFNIYI